MPTHLLHIPYKSVQSALYLSVKPCNRNSVYSRCRSCLTVLRCLYLTECWRKDKSSKFQLPHPTARRKYWLVAEAILYCIQAEEWIMLFKLSNHVSAFDLLHGAPWSSVEHSSASSFWCEIRLRSFMALRFFANKYLHTENGLHDDRKLCAWSHDEIQIPRLPGLFFKLRLVRR